jgi:hypothetical protein
VRMVLRLASWTPLSRLVRPSTATPAITRSLLRSPRSLFLRRNDHRAGAEARCMVCHRGVPPVSRWTSEITEFNATDLARSSTAR